MAIHKRYRVALPIVLSLVAGFILSVGIAQGQDTSAPDAAKPWPELNGSGFDAYVLEDTVWLKLSYETLAKRELTLPRLCAPVRSLEWSSDQDFEIKLKPSQATWKLSWQDAPADSSLIKMKFDVAPVLPDNCPRSVASGDGSIMLHAYQATTHGEKLMFEPQWYKNTVGYWAVDSDYVAWQLTIEQPGTFSIALLQGCGKGHGGSSAVVSMRQAEETVAELEFSTIDTGHFQNFRWNHLGKVKIESAGDYTLRIDAKSIASVALFDVRMIHLVRQATE